MTDTILLKGGHNMQKRILPIENGFNFRELGGYQTKDGQTIKWQKIIRSAGLANLNQNDLAFLERYGVAYDVDFRSPQEQASAPDLYPKQTQYKFLPVFATDETNVSKSPQELWQSFEQDPLAGHHHMLTAYDHMTTSQHSKQAYRDFFDILLSNDQDNQSVLFHCSAGKDRTGMGAVYFLTALGVPFEIIKQDYLLTNQTSIKNIQSQLQKIRQQPNATEQVVQNFKALSSVHEDYLATAVEKIKQQAGSIDHYLTQELKLSANQRQTLKQIYLN